MTILPTLLMHAQKIMYSSRFCSLNRTAIMVMSGPVNSTLSQPPEFNNELLSKPGLCYVTCRIVRAPTLGNEARYIFHEKQVFSITIV